jgi:hypothetical protein
MAESVAGSNGFPFACLLLILLALTACGTLEVVTVEQGMTLESPVNPGISTERSELAPVATAVPLDGVDESKYIQAVAWYGTILTVAGGQQVAGYLKPWHLNIWPKFGEKFAAKPNR